MNTRRDFLTTVVAGAVSGAAASVAAQQPEKRKLDLTQGWHGDETIAMVLYEGFTPLDLFGPHHMFILMGGAKVHLVAPTREPVTAEAGVKVTPTMTFDECPDKVTVLFVPGGSAGTVEAMQDERTRSFVADRGSKAEWVASVCTGSFILAAAGLLKGYKATSHWIARPELAAFGATPVDKRVVIDRNRITGAGVTAGLDLGLELVGTFRGDSYAQGTQLFAEYDPQPPYQAGNCKVAPPEIVTMLRDIHASFGKKLRAVAQQLDLGK